MNDRQNAYVADCLKIVAAGQLALLGFKQLTAGDVNWLYFGYSVALCVWLMLLGKFLLKDR